MFATGEKEALAQALLQEKKLKVHSLVNPQKLQAQQEHFDVPEWAGMPHEGVHLQAFKAGTSIETHMIDRSPYYLLGRSQVCDIQLDHMSISRVHCAIVHHESHSVYIIDLGSGYGTSVGGEKLPPKQPRKVTEDDEIVIGESSRVYRVKMSAPAGRKRKVEEVQPAFSAAAERRLEEEREEAARAAEKEILARADNTRQKGSADFWGGGRKRQRLEKTATPPPEVAVDTSEVRLSHILLTYQGTEECVADCVEDALQIAVDLRRTILLNLDGKGVAHSFAKAAKKSSCCRSASKKGVLGVVGSTSFMSDLCPTDVGDKGKLIQQDSLSEPLISVRGVHLLYRHPV